jgi:hypothetical protein
MSSARHIAVLGLCALTLSACAASIGFPDIPETASADTRNADWPEFLPVDTILDANAVDIIASETEIRRLQYRSSRLRQRARILRLPLSEAQEQLARLPR